MRSIWGALGVVLAICVGQLARAENSPAFTDYETIAEAMFPTTTYARRSVPISESERARIETYRKAVISLIKSNATQWTRAISSESAPNIKLIEEALSNAPVWIVPDKGGACGEGSSESYCVKSKARGDLVVTAIFLKECWFSPMGCKKSPKEKAKSPSASFMITLHAALARAAHAQLEGVKEKPETVAAAVARAQAVLSSSFAAVRAISDACPGPFSSSSLSFLSSTGHFKELDGYAETCAARLMAPFTKAALPRECTGVVSAQAWVTLVKNGFNAPHPRAGRCDEFCQSLTCASDEVAQRPRPMHFGSQWWVSIPHEACEGGSPRNARAFVEAVLDDIADETSSTSSRSRCLNALVKDAPASAPSKSERVSPADQLRDSGPEIELVE